MTNDNYDIVEKAEKKVEMELVGMDGNAFAIMGNFQRAEDGKVGTKRKLTPY